MLWTSWCNQGVGGRLDKIMTSRHPCSQNFYTHKNDCEDCEDCEHCEDAKTRLPTCAAIHACITISTSLGGSAGEQSDTQAMEGDCHAPMLEHN